jgi:hypothetical protein
MKTPHSLKVSLALFRVERKNDLQSQRGIAHASSSVLVWSNNSSSLAVSEKREELTLTT